MAPLHRTAVGTSPGVVIPKEMLSRLKLGRGDKLFVVETPSGYLLTPYDPVVERQVEIGKQVMRRYRNALRAMAK